MSESSYSEKIVICSSCGAENSLLRHTKCSTCGSSLDRYVFIHISPIDINDEFAISLAKCGSKWTCSSCGSHNLGSDIKCHSCTSPRESDDVEWGGEGLLSAYDGSSYNLQAGKNTPSSFNSPSFSKWPIFFISCVIILVVLFFIYLSSKKELLTGEIESINFKKFYQVQELVTRHYSGQDLSVPDNAFDVVRKRVYAGKVDIMEKRTKKVLVKKRCKKDLNNGAVEEYDCDYYKDVVSEVKVGERDVYENHVTYSVNIWTSPDDSPLLIEGSQSDFYQESTEFPVEVRRKMRLESNDCNYVGCRRQSGVTESFHIKIKYKEKEGGYKSLTYKVDSKDIDLWKSAKLSQKVPLIFNGFGVLVNNPLEKIDLEESGK